MLKNTKVDVVAEESKKAKAVRQEIYAWLENILGRPLNDGEHGGLSQLLQKHAKAKNEMISAQLRILEKQNTIRKEKERFKN